MNRGGPRLPDFRQTLFTSFVRGRAECAPARRSALEVKLCQSPLGFDSQVLLTHGFNFWTQILNRP